MQKTFKLPEFGYEVTLGKFANQADGAAWFNQGGTIVLSTVVSADSKDFPGFLPLTVDYREMFSAAGKIPGGYFKREGRATDKEVLTSRIIDRSVRPLFPSQFFDQLQVLSTVYSVDKENSPVILALMATSVALTISKLPFLGPIGAVEMARIDGKWITNPKFQESLKADARFIIVGTEEGIVMVEGNANQISEETFIDVLFMAHESIKKLVAWQLEIQKALDVQKQELQDPYEWNTWESRVDAFLTPERVKGISIPDKVERYAHLAALKDEFVVQYRADIDATANADLSTKVVNYIIDRTLEVKLTDLVLQEKKRVDGRPFDLIRPISVEVGLLPFAHGSALFKRGRTQALVTATLGGGDDEQRVETLMEDDSAPSKFMLHYNFPPFSVGEVRPQRGPGRREVGHGFLALSALRRVLPDAKEFPYTIRVVSDILECDGSSSMATVCGATMSLMQAGVPITKMVSGIAMGLLKSSKGDEFAVLSDITGMEDAFGLMDFKVTGTDEGITAIQMDIKYKGGLSRTVFENVLKQSREGRLHILGEMRKVMDKPNAELSALVPKLVMVKINQDKIGAIIGSGGKVIKEIIATTGTNIDIEPDGTVKIFGSPGALMDQAINWVKTLAGQIEPGTQYHGKVRRLADFGLFVELVPGLDGLVHVSNIPKNKQKTFLRDFKQDDMVTVQVIDYDASTGRVRLRLIEEPTKE